MQKIITNLAFDTQAEEAVRFYLSIFKDGEITKITHYGKDEMGPEGSVLTVAFRMFGQEFLALNGGAHFKFTDGFSLQVNCDSQEEIDELWEKLTADGGQPVECGWLTDKFGVSWQIVPTVLEDMITDEDPVRTGRVMQALLKMKKLEIEGLQKAYNGDG